MLRSAPNALSVSILMRKVLHNFKKPRIIVLSYFVFVLYVGMEAYCGSLGWISQFNFGFFA
jgi:hypothetical protein